jgi:hypothetical protein
MGRFFGIGDVDSHLLLNWRKREQMNIALALTTNPDFSPYLLKPVQVPGRSEK